MGARINNVRQNWKDNEFNLVKMYQFVTRVVENMNGKTYLLDHKIYAISISGIYSKHDHKCTNIWKLKVEFTKKIVQWTHTFLGSMLTT